jgi:hypothetical protein
VFENRVQRRIFIRKREEEAGGWRRLHNEELHKLKASPNITRVIKSRKMILAGHVAHIREMRIRTKFCQKKLEYPALMKLQCS